MISLWVATTNKGKLSEFKNILMNVAELHSPSELSAYTAPKETGTTFVENARIKAKSLHAVTGGWVVADDSGLVVESLGGLPGIHSARYAGEKASDGENISKLLKMMQ
ncbi:MAG TPA: non-canonical purine NTP pyrophosphatase, partial [Bdellovibrionales bacterium]|nr:non-canonical purine NTP pyrophosphatase [Bdellovibrionales bacterium]